MCSRFNTCDWKVNSLVIRWIFSIPGSNYTIKTEEHSKKIREKVIECKPGDKYIKIFMALNICWRSSVKYIINKLKEYVEYVWETPWSSGRKFCMFFLSHQKKKKSDVLWWQHHAVEILPSSMPCKTFQVRNQNQSSKNVELQGNILFSCTRELRLQGTFIFDIKHPAKATENGLPLCFRKTTRWMFCSGLF